MAKAPAAAAAPARPAAPAKKKSFSFDSVFYMLLSILALNFLGLVTFIVLSVMFGMCTPNDLFNMGQVLVGNHQYVMSRAQIAEYNALKDEQQKIETERAATLGNPTTRLEVAAAMKDAQRALEEQVRELESRRAEQERLLTTLRAEIETTRVAAQRENEKLAAQRRQGAAEELTANAQQLKKTLQAMEPAQLAMYFTDVLQKQGAGEVARMIRQYLTPDITAEIFGGMPDPILQRILPAMENRYMAAAPETIAKQWLTPGTPDFMSPPQMAEYLKRMSVPQAMAIVNYLPTEVRTELAPLLRIP